MLGTLYVIGVGPGDPELMTLKAVRIIKETEVICAPKGREEGVSLAMAIVGKVVDLQGKDIIEGHFPMMKTKRQGSGIRGQGAGQADELDSKWKLTGTAISERLQQGKDVVFITLGDPTIYSTFFYLHERLVALHPGLQVQLIPGVSSVNASAARAGVSLALADEKIAILPANYLGDLREIFTRFDSVVLMKVNKVWDKVYEILKEMGLVEKSVCVSRAAMEDEEIFYDINNIKQDELNYFSILIVRK
ncbi:MAG: precorrin-2 C(20)-methyltransferase [Nitrospira sp.]|nr:precorrin-2 C(20)-methyltransferase [bacterium]MBL7048704.1 precorrin-2 C(20)-methyltransferase [Nitrospira sp.]